MKNGKLNISRGIPTPDISRIQESFEVVASHGEQIVFRFYHVLFDKFPEFQTFFSQAQLAQQYAAFLSGFRTLVMHMENSEELRSSLVQLGERHRKYGIKSKHYPPVVYALLHVLMELGGESMDGKTYDAWENFLHLMRAIMLEAYSLEMLPGENRQKNFLSTGSGGHTKRILLIDDDRQLLDLYQSYLELEGYLCSQVSDVAWAFTHIQMSHYDLVLTDFQMPAMNGIQLRRNLEYVGNGCCPPFVLVTGSPNQEIRRQALESGFEAVLKKPHDLPELSSLVGKVLQKSMGFQGNLQDM
ncbi:response regulator [Candidatus Nitrospira allomarina]|uniref:Response regulator n=1 Tax=Candidatus Nitrospira allomarina TaxID=3020900 RepID=A0AA96GHZ3_9BACT|nr:response regulator [Candidatus Nitrospira allomarina]WNM59238.1 response regulator [Candidatus Nitrospira allomarina]